LTPEGSAREGLKEVMRVFPQGVTIVTTNSGEGPQGLTVSAFTSISLDPPLVLVSVSKASSVHQYLTMSKDFAVNFLADDQKSVSDRFAGRHEINDRFQGIGFSPGLTGAPIIQGVRAVVECRMWNIYDGGDHSLMIGTVVRAERLNEKPPLVYYVQQYTTTERVDSMLPPAELMW
jgi:flavin reductase (DIM6/NTAB) family NADH-FMN oxidoreductase RutF